jgi:cytochrome c peroxidase
MKVVPFILLFPLLFIILGLYENDRNHQNCADKVKDYYIKELTVFLISLDHLKQKEQAFTKEEELKKYFLISRERFKRVEFLLTYIDNKESKQINGANIVVNNYTYLTPNDEIQPHGLQVIESLIYHPTNTSREELKKEILLLEELIKNILRRTKRQNIVNPKEYNIIIWDAIRYELFRIESLGITGFDVPDSQNALPETYEAVLSLHRVIKIYETQFSAIDKKKHFKKGQLIFKKGENYLSKNKTDFDNFDRITFMKSFLHPIEKWMLESVKMLEVTYPQEVRPVSVEADFMFSEKFYNKSFFNSNSNFEVESLGEKLFYDKQLSSNGTRNCASCHNPNMAYSDGLTKNVSLDGKNLLPRNTPTLLNSVFQTKQFYDSRASNLERQSWDAIHNHIEMGGNLSKLIEGLKQDETYKTAFKKAFSNGEINQNNLLHAIASYVSSLTSLNSPFDKYFRDEKAVLSEDVKKGFNLFAGKAKCATCHFLPLFNGLVPPYYTDTESEIIGVPKSADDPKIIDPDLGKYLFTKLDLHRYAFKTSTSRNTEFTSPYMHNGVFLTIDELIEFYNKGGGKGQGMDLETQTLSSDSLKLNKTEISQIKQFLLSLTD